MTDWSALRASLARARAAGMDLPFWWRDDDAVEVTADLETLATISANLDVPVHVAVIPAHAQLSLGSYIIDNSILIPMVHGLSHGNFAPEGTKKSEFPDADSASVKRAEDGLKRSQNLFGEALLPVFVPPWNRMDTALTPLLQRQGYRAVSTFGPRQDGQVLPQINTHIDPIFWRGHRGLVDPDSLIATTVKRIDARIEGREDATEPLGYLTHHLVHTIDIWDFSQAFITELLDGGARPVDLRKELT